MAHSSAQRPRARLPPRNDRPTPALLLVMRDSHIAALSQDGRGKDEGGTVIGS